MSIFRSSKVTPLTLAEIEHVVRTYLKERGDINLDMDNVSAELLGGTPQWTLVQFLDNYLLAVSDKELYKTLLNNDKVLGLGLLPNNADLGLDTAFQIFCFLVLTRLQNDVDGGVEVCENAKKAIENLEANSFREVLNVFATKMVGALQAYELALDNPSDDGEFDDAIAYNLRDDQNLLHYYLSVRPQFANFVTNH